MRQLSAQFDNVFRDGLAAGIPQGGQTISSWAEKYRYVSAQRSARPGYWSNEVFPYLKGVMDAVTEPDVRKVVFQKSSQVGGTEFLVNVLTYYMHQDPSLMMYIGEAEDKSTAWKVECLDPTIMESPEIRRTLLDTVQGSRDNNKLGVRFRGGQLTIGWASSPAMLSSRPVRIIACDEVDAFEATKEGDPVKLAEARTKTFNESKKILLNSSPRDKETSIIEREYLASDQREFYVPCPHCGFYQTLKWSNVRWDSEETADEAYYICGLIENDALTAGCGEVIENDEKIEMLAKGIWRPGAGFKGTAGFKINELYSPMTSWGDMAVDFLQAKNWPDTLRVFVNTRLGETWSTESAEEIDTSEISSRCEAYDAEVPTGVEFLTAGVDVQDDRLEAEIVGWNSQIESWGIDRAVFHGSPSLNDVWEEAAAWLLADRENAEGRVFRVKTACVDTGGHYTDEAYAFCKKHALRRWYAVKGLSTRGKEIVSKPTKNNKGRVKLFGVGTDAAKDQIFANLTKIAEPGPGYCHFPLSDVYDEDFFKQLCAEKKVEKYRAGQKYFVYEKVTKNARNEALDIRVYATAAREIIFPRSRRRIVPGKAAVVEKPPTFEEMENGETSQAREPQARQEDKVVPFKRPTIRTTGGFDDFA